MKNSLQENYFLFFDQAKNEKKFYLHKVARCPYHTFGSLLARYASPKLWAKGKSKI